MYSDYKAVPLYLRRNARHRPPPRHIAIRDRTSVAGRRTTESQARSHRGRRPKIFYAVVRSHSDFSSLLRPCATRRRSNPGTDGWSQNGTLADHLIDLFGNGKLVCLSRSPAATERSALRFQCVMIFSTVFRPGLSDRYFTPTLRR